MNEATTIVYVHGGVSGAARREPPSLAIDVAGTARRATALDAVEDAVRALEDDPELNAGYGAILNRAGELELDAGIADGASGSWAGVANVAVRHPVSLARRLLEETPHVLVTGAGAAALGRALGFEDLEGTTPRQQERWERARRSGELSVARFGAAEHVDTVGAVALDAAGNLAAASSTGGVFGKLPGRVGDSPIFGAGTYASKGAAVVGTGVGELFLETLACLQAARLIEGGADPQAACEEIIDAIGRRDPSAAGLLALDPSGRAGAAYRGGSWVVEGPDGRVTPRRVGGVG